MSSLLVVTVVVWLFTVYSTGVPQPPQVRPPPPVNPPPRPPSGLDSDFVALQKIFEDMLSREDPPDYSDFVAKTSFIENKQQQQQQQLQQQQQQQQRAMQRQRLDAAVTASAQPPPAPPPPPPASSPPRSRAISRSGIPVLSPDVKRPVLKPWD